MNPASHVAPKLGSVLLKVLGTLLAFLIGAVLILVILGLGSCQLLEWSAQSRMREALPAQLEAGSFVYYKSCDPIFGGYAFAIQMSPEAATRLQREGLAFLAIQASPSKTKTPIKWTPSETSSWDYDGGTLGMYCYDYNKHDGQYVVRQMFRKGGYYATIGGTTYYIIPSMNLIVGGAEPGH